MESANKIIIVVGMPRSGTTLVAHILGLQENIKVEVEPHALWKVGDSFSLLDDDYSPSDEAKNYMRNKLLKDVGDNTLVEKSPVNCLRPQLVKAVFPDAKIVYVERNPVDCIMSNYVRSMKQDSFSPKIIFRKYFLYSGKKTLEGALSKRNIFQQIRFKDIFSMLTYVFKGFYYRNIKGILPFGPKLKDFETKINKYGLLGYHVEVYKAAKSKKEEFFKLFDDIEEFSLEKIQSGDAEVFRLLRFCGFSPETSEITNIVSTFDKTRISHEYARSKEYEYIKLMLKS